MGVVPCGMTFAERLRSVRLDKAKMDTAELHNYYDTQAIRDMFGDDAKDRYYEETDGKGAIFRTRRGFARRDRRSGDLVEVSPGEADTFLGSETEP